MGVWAEIECISDRTCKEWVVAIVTIHTCHQTGQQRMSGMRGDKALGELIEMKCIGVQEGGLGWNGGVAVPKYRHLEASNVIVSHKSSRNQFESTSGQLFL